MTLVIPTGKNVHLHSRSELNQKDLEKCQSCAVFECKLPKDLLRIRIHQSILYGLGGTKSASRFFHKRRSSFPIRTRLSPHDNVRSSARQRSVVKDARAPQRVFGEADKPVPADFAVFGEGRRLGRNESDSRRKKREVGR